MYFDYYLGVVNRVYMYTVSLKTTDDHTNF